MIPTLLLLGATGDLARRYVVPALGALHREGRLPDGFHLVGAAHTALDDHGFRRLVGDALPKEMVSYRPVDLADPSTLAAALDGTTGAVAAYLALPPAVFPTTIGSLGELSLPAGSRVAVEKPFGDDAGTAGALNALLAATGSDAYRVDHVLGMETTGNLVAIRAQSPVLDRIWNGATVDHVEILWEETLGLEGRAAYYDRAGALKDVLQNHMLQLLALVGMERPVDDDLHDRKLEVLRSARVAIDRSRRARYTAGTLADGRPVPGYAHEDGVDPARSTETFAEIVLDLAMPRWAGTRFVLRAGKALARRRKLVHLAFRGGGEFEIGIDGPEDAVLRLPSSGSDPVELRSGAPGDGMPAYAHVLLDILAGTNDLSVGAGEAEEAWRVVAPVLAAWQAGTVPLEEYPAGSPGPS
jgi:glucose-6-phosphate 1-dehydrogenase